MWKCTFPIEFETRAGMFRWKGIWQLFGYITPNIPELRVRDKTRYEAWYCGLCRCLGKRYGLVSRACLSYDCAFLAMLVHSLKRGIITDLDESGSCTNSGESSANIIDGYTPLPCSSHACPFKPFARKRAVIDGESPALDFAAAVCVLLSMYKLRDDVADGKPFRALAELPLSSAFFKAKRDYPSVADSLADNLAKLSAIEKNRTASPDTAADAFGVLLRDVLMHSPAPSGNAQPLSELGYHMGRYIYLLDAWDDRRSDEKHRLYNPFVLSETKRTGAEFLIYFSINSAISAYNLLEVRYDKELIDNIVTQGCFAAADRIFNKEGNA